VTAEEAMGIKTIALAGSLAEKEPAEKDPITVNLAYGQSAIGRTGSNNTAFGAIFGTGNTRR
jgi:hypothetical protein